MYLYDRAGPSKGYRATVGLYSALTKKTGNVMCREKSVLKGHVNLVSSLSGEVMDGRGHSVELRPTL